MTHREPARRTPYRVRTRRIRVVWLLEALGIAYRLRPVDLPDVGNDPEFLEINPAGFIPALQHPTTLVMTASRADRASFGCENENDWTFFGNALFNNGLRTTTSLLDAFSAAKELIAGWEAKEKFKPSEPQIYVGEGIRPVLDRLARLSSADADARSRRCATSVSSAEQQASVHCNP